MAKQRKSQKSRQDLFRVSNAPSVDQKQVNQKGLKQKNQMIFFFSFKTDCEACSSKANKVRVRWHNAAFVFNLTNRGLQVQRKQ